MSKKTKILIILIVIIAIVLIIMLVTKNKKSTNNNINESANLEETQNNVTEEYVRVLTDGSKVNISAKLHTTKELGNLEISEVNLTEKDGVTVFSANVLNKSDSVDGDYSVSITLLDENGNTITVLHGYIDKLESGEITELNINSTIDYANSYDYVVSKD